MSPPTDLELMMYFDGELDELRGSEVRAFLAASQGPALASRAKLDGLSLVGDLLREGALARSAQADSIADDVMKKIRADEPRAIKIGLEPQKRSASPASQRPAAPAANDNGRLIFGLSALAAAAAAALFLWGRNPPAEAPTAATTAITEGPTELLPPPLAEAPSPATSAKPQLPGEEDEQPSAEVASVDFGSRAGAVYYVSGDNAGADGRNTTTTVVWLTDE